MFFRIFLRLCGQVGRKVINMLHYSNNVNYGHKLKGDIINILSLARISSFWLIYFTIIKNSCNIQDMFYDYTSEGLKTWGRRVIWMTSRL